MSGSYDQTGNNPGELMAYLLSARHRYATEEEFKAFALESVRRFITDLRRLNIEVSMRPNYLERTPLHSSPVEKLVG
jgi:hypothetical protein